MCVCVNRKKKCNFDFEHFFQLLLSVRPFFYSIRIHACILYMYGIIYAILNTVSNSFGLKLSCSCCVFILQIAWSLLVAINWNWCFIFHFAYSLFVWVYDICECERIKPNTQVRHQLLGFIEAKIQQNWNRNVSYVCNLCVFLLLQMVV